MLAKILSWCNTNNMYREVTICVQLAHIFSSYMGACCT